MQKLIQADIRIEDGERKCEWFYYCISRQMDTVEKK